MKGSPYLSSLTRIMSVKQAGARARIIRLKTKLSSTPGQFMIASVSGEGETALPLASSRSAELLVIQEDNVTESICNLKKGDKLGLRGPYGKGFPKEIMRKEWIMVAEGYGLAYARALFEQWLSDGRSKREHVLISVQSSVHDQIMAESLGDLAGKISLTIITRGSLYDTIEKIVPSPERIFILLIPESQATAERLCAAGCREEQVFIHVPRRLSCGTGRCGRCMVGSKHMCQDGPVFRYDQVKGML